MNKVIIKKIEMQNFKGISKGCISFENTITQIKACNGAGKTTIKNAFEWCMCQNVSNILPMLDNKEIPHLETKVTVYLDINNIEYTFEKINRSTYLQDTNNKTGNKTIYKIDGIEIEKEKDYKEKLANIVGNGVFDNLSMLIDKEYFNTDTTKFKWNDRRKILYEMCDVKSQIENISNKEEYAEISTLLKKGFATSDIKSKLTKEKKVFKEMQNKNNILIEQKQQEIEELSTINFEELEKKLKQMQDKLEKLQNSSKKENQTEQITQLQDKLFELVHKQSVKESDYKTQLLNQERLSREIYNDCSKLKIEIDALKDTISQEEQKQLAMEEVSDTCPVCHRKYEEDFIHKQKQANSKVLEELKSNIEKLKLELQDLISKYNTKIENYKKTNENIKNFKFVPDKQLEDSIIQTKKALETAKASNLNNLSTEQISSLKIEISKAQQDLAKKEFIEKAKYNIEVWKNQNIKTADEILSIERKEDALTRYISEEVAIIKNTINNKFPKDITWALYKETYKNGEGGLEEDCVCMYKNKRYDSLSNGEKNIANLLVVKTLQNYYGVNLPIFSDNAESITIPYKMENQIIELYAQGTEKLENIIKIEDVYKK